MSTDRSPAAPSRESWVSHGFTSRPSPSGTFEGAVRMVVKASRSSSAARSSPEPGPFPYSRQKFSSSGRT